MADSITIAKARIEAAALTARTNAQKYGGDDATAAGDLMCAFVLVAIKSGADPDKALAAMWEHAKAAVADFWPDQKVH